MLSIIFLILLMADNYNFENAIFVKKSGPELTDEEVLSADNSYETISPACQQEYLNSVLECVKVVNKEWKCVKECEKNVSCCWSYDFHDLMVTRVKNNKDCDKKAIQFYVKALDKNMDKNAKRCPAYGYLSEECRKLKERPDILNTTSNSTQNDPNSAQSYVNSIGVQIKQNCCICYFISSMLIALHIFKAIF